MTKLTFAERAAAIAAFERGFHEKYEPPLLWPKGVDVAWEVKTKFGRYIATYLVEEHARERARLEGTGVIYAPFYRDGR